MSRAVSDSVSVVAIGLVSGVTVFGNVGSVPPDAQPQAGGKGDPEGEPWAAGDPAANVPDVVQLASERLGGAHHLGPGTLDLLAELGLGPRSGAGELSLIHISEPTR